jgi:hypothetical protein
MTGGALVKSDYPRRRFRFTENTLAGGLETVVRPVWLQDVTLVGFFQSSGEIAK